MLCDIISPVTNFFAMLVRYWFLCELLGSSLYLLKNQCSHGHGHPAQLVPPAHVGLQ